METPTISRAQKRSTLSGKKTKIKETIKNVVATPYRTSYWPLISPEDHEMLRTVLQNNLPRVKPKKNKIPWKILKNIPKPDRKTFRNEYTKKGEPQINKRDGDGLTFGINDVTKLLENNLISCILITGDVQPRIMVIHIIDQAVLYKVPVIVFENLRSLLSQVCGLSSAVIGINKNINPESKLTLIKETIVQIFEKYPVPTDHINYNRSQETVTATETRQVKNKETSLPKNDTESNDEMESTIYLKRESNDKRVFVPENSKENIRNDKMEVDSNGFIPFSSTPIETEEKPIETNYRSLIVKRLKGDPNRSKRKIVSLKRKPKHKKK